MRGLHPPGAGLAILLATALAAAAFLAWGLRTPTLERVWQLQIELGLGVRKALSTPERELLAAALLKNPGLAEGMLGEATFGIISANRDGLIDNGYLYLVARKGSRGRTMELRTTDRRGGDPVPIEVTAGAAVTRGEVKEGAPFVWELPDDHPLPALIEVRFGSGEGPEKKGGPDRPGMLVRTREQP